MLDKETAIAICSGKPKRLIRQLEKAKKKSNEPSRLTPTPSPTDITIPDLKSPVHNRGAFSFAEFILVICVIYALKPVGKLIIARYRHFI